MSQTCGFVAIVGRPNVGKSTLMNRILGQKISITSRRPQTTRHQVLGIKTEGDAQAIFVDTPGIHILGKDRNKAINRFMNQAAVQALRDVDCVVFLVDRTRWTEEDQIVLDRLANVEAPVILAVNKVDRLQDKATLLPWLAELGNKREFAAVVPIAAQHGTNVPELEAEIDKHLPEGIHFFPEDQVTDKSMRFLAAEMVREKVMRQLGDELPYQMTVEIEEFRDEARVVHISALILVERQGQKKILIGDSGDRIKKIGREARLDMERALDKKVMLNLWVKVKRGWSDDERALKSLGYDLD
ncbi:MULTISPECIES: GTPase Era [Halomonas]|uniref:GTPase Era n=3 Tax=Halomonas TaxID=2745 RepID=A0AAU7KNI4_9GAMM|nr:MULTISPECIES: GTPase Era [Halomonas]MBR9769697.1 GTPase Era [Gammaproteobacteria bacterium]KJZ10612.1 GTPase Era [Halomonas sp. S2151]MAR70840.1 GTPase Era [Halomonas sp.]MAY72323.1 GTPase Era [Halomonas sp.]MBR9878787.1 GTPase Era [Gammaproteobacteria bacterium]|tara:strand:- start:469 stop:1368 length:900 start_codon:yes stop_codon:yes gene_type:complete